MTKALKYHEITDSGSWAQTFIEQVNIMQEGNIMQVQSIFLIIKVFTHKS